MRRFLAAVIAANNRLTDAALAVAAWSAWLNIIAFGVAIWLIIDQVSRDHFDPGKSTIVLVLTIQTALSSEAANLRGRRDRETERKREERRATQIDDIETIAFDIKRLVDSVCDEQERSRVRDEQGSERDHIIIDLSTQIIDQLEKLKGKA